MSDWVEELKQEVSDGDAVLEALARMWVKCDPNRGGTDPDADITLHDGPNKIPAKQWQWFVPRAHASLDFLREQGFAVVPLTKDHPHE